MAIDRSGPAVTTMMGVVHDALRRDLTRAQDAVRREPPPGDEQRQAIAAHVGWMMDFLHHHHSGEDTGLYPLVRQVNPGAAELLDRMDADHQGIHAGMDRVTAASGEYGRSAGEPARLGLVAALDELNGPLFDHLRREEDDMMPVVSASITHQQWDDWEQKANVKGKSVLQLADEGHWMADGLDPARYDHLVHLVPAPARFVILKGLAGRYRRAARRRWGADVAVGPAV